jgi:cis-3-alkyl-4-acyloxetan-2-one decarboxylase
MLHGNPTWGYLYRKFISTLSKQGYRCIVPDHLGYGRSDKPSHPDIYRYEKHCERLNALLISLNLSKVTLISSRLGWTHRYGLRARSPFLRRNSDRP